MLGFPNALSLCSGEQFSLDDSSKSCLSLPGTGKKRSRKLRSSKGFGSCCWRSSCGTGKVCARRAEDEAEAKKLQPGFLMPLLFSFPPTPVPRAAAAVPALQLCSEL